MVSGETKICPVCDSSIDVDARRCPECNTDLSLFDVDGDLVPDIKEPPAEGKSIDDILASIMGGKDVRPEIFEQMKSVATTPAEDDILADTTVESGVEFECPNCGARVAATAQVCPSCGVQFADEAVEQFECPLCNAVVDMDATSCPNCGVKFAEEPAPTPSAPVVPTPAAPPAARSTTPPARPVEDLDLEIPAKPPEGRAGVERLRSIVASRRRAPEEPRLDRATLYKELPRLVNEVKPLLLLAKKVGVEIGEERALISDAIAQGKKREVERAVHLIRQARFQLEESYTSQVAERAEEVLVGAERSRASGGDVGAILTLCASAIDALEARDYEAAADKVRAAREELEARAGGYGKAREELATVRALLADVKKIGLGVREAEGFVARAESAMAVRNWDQAAGYAVQAKQAVLKALPDALTNEMKRARNALLEMKVKGGDLTKPVGILKQASIHMKREEYADAVRFVRMFRDEIGTA